MTRYRKRVDGNHAEVRAAWIARGWTVTDTSRIGYGFPDLVGMKPGYGVRFVEVKDGKKSPSKRRLTEAEIDMRDLLVAAGCVWLVVERVEDLP